MKKSIILLAGLCLALVGLYAAPACAAQEDEALKNRAQAYCDAQVKQDWKVLYRYLPPSARDQVSEDQFTELSKQKMGIRYLSFELEKAETAGDIGWVKLVQTAMPEGFKSVEPMKTERWEPWKKIEGEWYPIPAKEREAAPSRPPSERSATEEATLTKRADEFWGAMEKNEWGIIYTYLEPDFRKTTSLGAWLGKKPFYIYVGHSVEWAEVTGDRGKVMVVYLVRPSDPYQSKMEPLDQTIVENWVRIEGVWYRLVPQKKS